jgi:hypothetical protein
MSGKPLRPSELPQVEAQAHYAWREGWWQGLPVGLVMGFALAVVLFKH